MRRACVLRQLGRCAVAKPLPPPPTSWSSDAMSCSGLGRRELRRRARERSALSGIQASHFTTSSTLQAPWKISRPVPPSEHPHPHTTSFDALEAPEQFRSVMRLLPNSVVVCTATGTESVPRGMTMSSFTSLSLHPTPLITFNIATPSRTLDAVLQSREFNIHVLSGDVEGARVADWFRWGNSSDLGVFDVVKMRDGCGCEAVQGQEGTTTTTTSTTTAPLLRGSGVLYGLKCKLLDDEPHHGLMQVRDHVVVLAEVVDIVEGRGEPHGQEVFGLAYADRRYRQLGGTMLDDED